MRSTYILLFLVLLLILIVFSLCKENFIDSDMTKFINQNRHYFPKT